MTAGDIIALIDEADVRPNDVVSNIVVILPPDARREEYICRVTPEDYANNPACQSQDGKPVMGLTLEIRKQRRSTDT